MSPDTIKSYFQNLKVSLEGVPPQNIINYDETNLSDDPGKKSVLVKRGYKYPESSTSVMLACIADGKLLPPYVVYKATHLYDIDTWTHGRTPSGWFHNFSFQDWVETIALSYISKCEGRCVLIGDNQSSHFSIE